MPAVFRTVVAALLAVLVAAAPAAALPLAPTAGLDRMVLGAAASGIEPRLKTAAAAPETVLPAIGVLGDGEITAIEGPPLDNVPEPDTLALLGGAVAALAVVALIRRKRRGK